MSEKKVKAARRAAREAAQEAATTLYLDTSSIRTGGKHLQAVNREKRAWTSVLTLIELLNGIRKDEESFLRRRGALRNLMGAGLFIEWRSKDALVLSTFNLIAPIADYYHQRRSAERSLRRIIQLAIDAKDLAEFRQQITAADLEYQLTATEEYDHYIASKFVQNWTEGLRSNKKIFDEIQSGVRPRPPRMPDLSLKDWAEWFLKENKHLNDYMMIKALAYQAQYLVGEIGQGPLSVDALIPSYNRKLHTFVEAASVHEIRSYGLMNLPDRNDGVDLMHFYYLDRNTILITEDGRQRGYAENIGLPVRSIQDYARQT